MYFSISPFVIWGAEAATVKNKIKNNKNARKADETIILEKLTISGIFIKRDLQ
jgi:hypothetical protein